jgi:hypothetical protein
MRMQRRRANLVFLPPAAQDVRVLFVNFAMTITSLAVGDGLARKPVSDSRKRLSQFLGSIADDANDSMDWKGMFFLQ